MARKGKNAGKGNRQGSSRNSRDGPSRSQPVAKTRNRMTGRPSISTNGAGILVKHREFLWDFQGASDFSYDSMALNPGLQGTFPWLAGIADHYEKYRFRKLRILYRPACSTATPGSVTGAVDHDAADPAPLSKVDLLSYFGAQRCAPWADMSIDVLAGLSDTPRYVRKTNLASNLDIKTYDLGVLYLAADGQIDSKTIGEVLIEYEVELFIPQVSSIGESTTMIIDPTTVSSLTPFGTAVTSKVGNADVQLSPEGLLYSNTGFEGLIQLLYSTTHTCLPATINTELTTATASVIGSTTKATSPNEYVMTAIKAILPAGKLLGIVLNTSDPPGGANIRCCSGLYSFL